ncbi:hypothetical protein BGZ80_006873, partial [Entomortierella chlamydospora]
MSRGQLQHPWVPKKLEHIPEHEFFHDQPYNSNNNNNGVSTSGCHGMTNQIAHDAIHKDDNDSPKISERKRLLPITHIKVLQGQGAQLGPDWERVEGNLNDGNRGPVLTLFVKRERGQAPIESLVVKYGFDSHAAIGYDRVPMDLNVGTDTKHVIDNIAVLLGSNPVPPNWDAAAFESGVGQDVPDWNAQVIYRTSNKALPKAPTLRFNEDGSFKIVQFADIHMATGPHSCHNVPST